MGDKSEGKSGSDQRMEKTIVLIITYYTRSCEISLEIVGMHLMTFYLGKEIKKHLSVYCYIDKGSHPWI